MKDYLPSIIAGLVMLVAVPSLLGVIFLSGDSYNSSDTSSTMRLVTGVIVLTGLVISFVLNITVMIIRKKKSGKKLIIGTLLTWFLSSSIYVVFVENLVKSAFG